MGTRPIPADCLLINRRVPDGSVNLLQADILPSMRKRLR